MSEVGLVDKQVIADEQRLLHRFRGNLESLHNKRDDENCDCQCARQRLQGIEAIPDSCLRLGFRRWTVDNGLGAYFAHDFSEGCASGAGASTAALLSSNCRCSHARRAAACSAAFLLLPSPRRMKASPPDAEDGT